MLTLQVQASDVGRHSGGRLHLANRRSCTEGRTSRLGCRNEQPSCHGQQWCSSYTRDPSGIVAATMGDLGTSQTAGCTSPIPTDSRFRFLGSTSDSAAASERNRDGNAILTFEKSVRMNSKDLMGNELLLS